MIFTALRTYYSLREYQGNVLDALTFAEECYNLVVVAYDPVHIQVHQAAEKSINRKGELSVMLKSILLQPSR